MTEPLINRDRLAVALWLIVPHHFGTGLASRNNVLYEDMADEVIDCLRNVLTPEALEPREMEGEGFVRTTYWADGTDLHRRIFGESR